MADNREEKNVAINFLAGMGLGALIGAATALLLAPKPGTETRQDLAHAAEDLKVKANKVVQDLSESTDEIAKKSRELLESTRTKVQSAIDASKQAMARRREEMGGEAGAEVTGEEPTAEGPEAV